MNRKVLFLDPPGAYHRVVNTGLGYIASSLRKKKDCNFKVLDLSGFRDSGDTVLKNAFDPANLDAVGISLNVGSMHALPALLKKVKDCYPNSKVFIGGSHVYLEYKKLLADFAEFVDFAVIGETETIIADIVECVEDKNKLSAIPGVILNDEIDKEVYGDRIENIDTLDFPNYEYFESVRQNNCSMEYYPIMTSRGCPYSCTFCAGPKISGKKWRFRNPESVVDEIEFALRKYKTQDLEIFDDNFLLDKERAMKIIEMILKRNIKTRFRFGNGIRADKLDEENVKIMKKAGLWEANIGIETADPEQFLSIKKGESWAKIENAIKLLNKYDIPVGASFIIGLPGSTLEKDMKSVKFANRQGLTWRHTAWCYFTPYRFTDAYEMIKENVGEEKIEKSYRRGHFTANYIETKDYPLEERIIVRSIGARIPPIHSDYGKWKLFKLFVKMELIIFRHRDRNLSFWHFNLSMLKRLLLFAKAWPTKKINKDAYY